MDLAANDNEISWKKWAVVKRQNPKTGKEMNKREQVNVHDPVPDLVREFVAEIKTLSVHLFQAHWQITLFAELTKKIPDGRAAITIDFAENYTCISQNEVQVAHWANMIKFKFWDDSKILFTWEWGLCKK